jgi:hypothetical protein
MAKPELGIILQAQIEGIRTRKDHTYSITIGTQELAPEIGARLFALNNNLANVYISPNAIQSDLMREIDLASVDVVDLQKTPSKRMKAILYLLWKQNPEGYEDANLYYQNKMENFITHLKSKLD